MAALDHNIPIWELNDGNKIPAIGYGTGTAWYKTAEGDIDRSLVESIKMAIGMGYLHLDGAEIYKTERELGIAIKESKVEREKLFVTTKVKTTTDIVGTLQTCLKKLQLDYVDLYLIHEPFSLEETDDKLQKAWEDMEKVKSDGQANSIGVSNCLPHHLKAILKTAKVKPAVNQIEFNPYLQHRPSDLLGLHREHKIMTCAYAPLMPVTRAQHGPIDDFVSAVAKKHAVNPSEILLRWCMDQGIIPITTSSKEQRLSDYLRVLAFKLTPREVEEIAELGEKQHYRAFWTKQFESEDRS